jgi:hypothetical protein
VRLDLPADRRSLDQTVAELQPRLLVLDPFVRLHRIDENASGEVAPLLAYLRELQRSHGIAVIVVHHAKKGAGGIRAGQALRGSSEFHAWGDSNLYLRRNRDSREGGDIILTVEHRAAPAMPAATLELAQRANALALEVVERRTPQTPAPSSVDERITAALTDVDHPLPFAELRARCRVRTATLYERLAALTAAGRLGKSDQGYRIAGRWQRTHDNQAETTATIGPISRRLPAAASGSLYSVAEEVVGSPSRCRPTVYHVEMPAPPGSRSSPILLFDRRHPSAPTCARHVPTRAAAVKDGTSSGHRASGAKRP